MKLIVDIPEKDFDFIKKTYKPTGYDFVARPLTNETISSVMNGTPLDSVIEDIKAEIRKLHPVKRGDNDYTNGVYDGECWVIDKALFIIDKHISGKENE